MFGVDGFKVLGFRVRAHHVSGSELSRGYRERERKKESEREN